MISILVEDKTQTQQLAEKIGTQLKAGDVVLLSGDLGAGKTTFTQGLAKALSVRGNITSPTFVIARLHPNLGEGPALLHVDAYRLNSLAEIADLDLVSDLSRAIVVVEWPRDMVDDLTDNPIKINLITNPDNENQRTLEISAGKELESFLQND
jgi:tRNA threonylcarbamoyladenosine biosynthesis protein TsaE